MENRFRSKLVKIYCKILAPSAFSDKTITKFLLILLLIFFLSAKAIVAILQELYWKQYQYLEFCSLYINKMNVV